MGRIEPGGAFMVMSVQPDEPADALEAFFRPDGELFCPALSARGRGDALWAGISSEVCWAGPSSTRATQTAFNSAG